uniref:Uncharacterized protein n=1 Tax=Anguilla anguilla TaxID=7936 RepID=A0A0E9QKE7_ANGAN
MHIMCRCGLSGWGRVCLVLLPCHILSWITSVHVTS